MVKYKELISKLMSNLFFRTLLCMGLLMFGALFVRFSSSFTIYAKNIDEIELGENQFFIIENTLQRMFNDKTSRVKCNISSSYIIASINNSDDYPKNWIDEFNKKIIILQEMFPNGKYWNHMGKEQSNPKETNNVYSVTDIPCNHSQYGEIYCNAHYGKSDEVYPYEATCCQCRGFASILSDLVFGEDAPVRFFEDYDELKIGDQARIDGDFHSVFIIDKTDDYVIVAECNSDLETCQIQWGRKILREDMDGWYISRWSDGVNVNGDVDN